MGVNTVKLTESYGPQWSLQYWHFPFFGLSAKMPRALRGFQLHLQPPLLAAWAKESVYDPRSEVDGRLGSNTPDLSGG